MGISRVMLIVDEAAYKTFIICLFFSKLTHESILINAQIKTQMSLYEVLYWYSILHRRTLRSQFRKVNIKICHNLSLFISVLSKV